MIAVGVVPGTYPPTSPAGWQYSGQILNAQALANWYIADVIGAPGVAGNMSAALNAIDPVAYPNTAVFVSLLIPQAFDGTITDPAVNEPPGTAISATLGGFTMEQYFAASYAGFENSHAATQAHFLLPFTPGQFTDADFIATFSSGGLSGGVPVVMYLIVLYNVDPMLNVGFAGGASGTADANLIAGTYFYYGPSPFHAGLGFFGIVFDSGLAADPSPVSAVTGDLIIVSYGAVGPYPDSHTTACLYIPSLRAVTGSLGTPTSILQYGQYDGLSLEYANVTADGSIQASASNVSYILGGSAAVVTVIKAFVTPVTGGYHYGKFVAPGVFLPNVITNASQIEPRVWMPRENIVVQA